MKYVLSGLLGGILVFIILKYVIKKPVESESKTTENLLNIAGTKEARELIFSNEFKALMKTDQFKTFATEFGTEQLVNFIAL